MSVPVLSQEKRKIETCVISSLNLKIFFALKFEFIFMAVQYFTVFAF